MTNNPTIDGVSRELVECDACPNSGGCVKTCMKAAPTISVCRGCFTEQPNGRPCATCEKVESERAPAVERRGPVAEVVATGGPHDKEDRVLVKLQAELPPIGTKIYAVPPEVAALQSTIAHLKALISELESGHGEPFAWYTEDYLTDKSATTYDMPTASRWKAKGWPVQPLYIAPPAPVAVVLPDRDLLRDKIAEAIGGDTYDCTRAWSAWGVGTMDQDDFVSLIDQEERLYEIVDACLDATAALNGERK